MATTDKPKRPDMARFRKVYPRLWSDHDFLSLSNGEKVIALLALTGPQSNRIGLFEFSPAMSAERLGWDAGTFAEGFGKVCERLNWTFDERARVLFIPGWWKWNPPDGANILIGNLKDLLELPQTRLIQDFAANTKHLPENLRGTFTQRLSKGYPKGSATQEKEKEKKKQKEQEKKQDKTSCRTLRSDETDLDLAKWMWKLIHDLQRTRKEPNLDKWANAFRLMRERDGRTEADIRALFAWANQDDFWQTNILSPQKLREHWDTLKLKKDRPNGKSSNRNLVGAGQRHDPTAAERDPDHGKM